MVRRNMEDLTPVIRALFAPEHRHRGGDDPVVELVEPRAGVEDNATNEPLSELVSKPHEMLSVVNNRSLNQEIVATSPSDALGRRRRLRAEYEARLAAGFVR